MVHDGLTNPFTGKHMGEEADEVGEELEITRADMDKFALRSHELAIQATDEGRLPEEITPVTISSKKGDTTVEVDEAPRRESSLESLSKLRGAFHKDGAHTAGNAPGVNDGAGALVLSSDEWAKSNGRTPLATIVAQAAVADEFPYLARTPANATTKALEQAGLSVDDIDLFEINEAFASVALNSMRMLGVDESKVNVNGGAIALGHPIGASGARILMTLVHELRRRGGGLGCRGDLLRRRPGRRRDRRGQRQLAAVGASAVRRGYAGAADQLAIGTSTGRRACHDLVAQDPTRRATVRLARRPCRRRLWSRSRSPRTRPRVRLHRVRRFDVVASSCRTRAADPPANAA